MVKKLMMRAKMSQPQPSPDLNFWNDDRRVPCPTGFVNNYQMNLAYIILPDVRSIFIRVSKGFQTLTGLSS